MKLTRRSFNKTLGAVAGAAALGRFAKEHPNSKVLAESGTSDPDMINQDRLRHGVHPLAP